ncbi:MAG: protein kinase [Rubrivivax sp.]
MPPCASPDELLDYLAGRLDARGTAQMREHVAGCSSCHAIACDLVHAAARGGARPPRARVQSYALEPGGVVAGRYELESCLGEGGMGSVWSAVRRDDGARVAIKLLKGFGVNARRRFQREAAIASSLVHDELVRVLEVLDDVEAGCPALVMERLEGEPLSARLHRGPLTAGDARTIGASVARALVYVHDASIVHRDLSLANVFLVAGGVKVLDLGLATLLDESAGGVATRITRTGQVVGTLSCMAPEQMAGERATSAVDVWALGTILHASVSGAPPFAGRTAAELLRAIATSAPARLDVPYADLVLEMLRAAPSERPSMHEVRSALVGAGPGAR